ncbi:hypothetical protein CHUAL_004259 [Chamberlinius hualienensis]
MWIIRCVFLTFLAFHCLCSMFAMYMNVTLKHYTLLSLCIWIPVSIISITDMVIYVFCLRKKKLFCQFFQNLVIVMESSSYKTPENVANIQKISKVYFFIGIVVSIIQFLLFNYNSNHGFFKDVLLSDKNLPLQFEKAIVWNLYAFLASYELLIMLGFALIPYSFLWWYTSLFCLTCKIISNLFKDLSNDRCRGEIQEYQKKHSVLCALLKDADKIFGPFLFFGLVKDFITMVLFFKVLCSVYYSLTDSIITAYVVLMSLLAFAMKVVNAAKVNDQVLNALNKVHDYRIDYSLNSINLMQEQTRHILFIEYMTQLSNNTVGFTAWKLMKLKNSLIFTVSNWISGTVEIIKSHIKSKLFRLLERLLRTC